jgi:hypothetical protein
MLERANHDWRAQMDMHSSDPGELGAFAYWLKQQYGLEIELIDGNIGAARNIVNEKKYTIFLLKYGA